MKHTATHRYRDRSGPTVSDRKSEAAVLVRTFSVSLPDLYDGEAPSLVAHVWGWKIKKDGTPGAYSANFPVPLDAVPAEIMPGLLANLRREVLHERDVVNTQAAWLLAQYPESVNGQQGEGGSDE